MKKYIIFILLVIMLIVVTYFTNKSQDTENLTVLPPLIFVSDELYQGGVQFKTEVEFNNLKSKPIEIGTIESNVGIEKIPSINFQSNSAPVGSILYNDKNTLYCKENDKYWIYEVYEEKAE